MNCPLCTDQVLQATHRQGIELDVCPRCRGIWLDRGELERLMNDDEPARSDDRPPTREERVPDDRYRDDRYEDDRYQDDRYRDDRRPAKKKRFADRLSDVFEDVLDF
ncbi:MAG TPA: zf-TFIIB domain-containing protein, partial [Microthrixaceae bacterium]|nr:zf-TFIIB domain-containing protein [Microthrixaceae bacterium]